MNNQPNPEPAVAFRLDAPTGGANRGVLLSAPAQWNGYLESLAFAPVTVLASLLQSRRITSRQIVEQCLRRIERLAAPLYCVVSQTPFDAALAAADRADAEIMRGQYRGLLHGIPYGAKDSFATRELPTTDGAKRYASRVLGYDAVAVTRLENTGAILLAKLSMGELAMDDVWYGGQTRNPWNPEAGSSGSSAGSASAVAAGLLPFALGGETWGSIVSPCAVCGTTGLRPTPGRLPRTGVSALSWSMDKIGVITRSVADCALVMDALRGADAGDLSSMDAAFDCDLSAPLTDLRIGYDVSGFAALPDEQIALFDDAKARIETMCGAALVPVELPALSPEYDALPMTIIGVEGATSYAAFIADNGLNELVRQGEDNWPQIFRRAQSVTAVQYLQAQQLRARLQAEMTAALAGIDVYLTPSCRGESLRYTNLAGQPEVVTRAGFAADGSPVALSVVGNLWREDAALRVAHAFEQMADLSERVPPGFA
ncbi:MAG: amidase [Armatimonadetes bacterium]|nr:amidase [Armatimonadota bacterium]